ncbi:MAG: NAD-dependent deacylase [Rhodothermia bacterium]|nr:MAG: NAD-dependent deacylase [Rhodothermia bacterium]
MNSPATHSNMPSERLLTRLKQATSLCVLTGAGISVESGLSTFRDPGGLWEEYSPEDLANEAAFRRDPQLVQGWYQARLKQAKGAQPNAGHLAITELDELCDRFLLVTQNVDTLHKRAGTKRMVELHGNIVDERCIECGEPSDHAVLSKDGLRCCADCSGLLRPGVVWFGESLPTDPFERASEAALTSDVFLSVGTSSIVYPAAGLPLLAKQSGAYVVEINVEPSALSHAMDELLLGPADDILPALVEHMRSAQNQKELERITNR